MEVQSRKVFQEVFNAGMKTEQEVRRISKNTATDQALAKAVVLKTRPMKRLLAVVIIIGLFIISRNFLNLDSGSYSPKIELAGLTDLRFGYVAEFPWDSLSFSPTALLEEDKTVNVDQQADFLRFFLNTYGGFNISEDTGHREILQIYNSSKFEKIFGDVHDLVNFFGFAKAFPPEYFEILFEGGLNVTRQLHDKGIKYVLISGKSAEILVVPILNYWWGRLYPGESMVPIEVLPDRFYSDENASRWGALKKDLEKKGIDLLKSESAFIDEATETGRKFSEVEAVLGKNVFFISFAGSLDTKWPVGVKVPEKIINGIFLFFKLFIDPDSHVPGQNGGADWEIGGSYESVPLVEHGPQFNYLENAVNAFTFEIPNKAMLSKSSMNWHRGGIDLRADGADIRIRQSANGFQIPVADPAVFKQLSTGFSPVIISLSPMSRDDMLQRMIVVK